MQHLIDYRIYPTTLDTQQVEKQFRRDCWIQEDIHFNSEAQIDPNMPGDISYFAGVEIAQFVTDREFATKKAALEWLQNNHEKYTPPLAIRWKKSTDLTVWIIGGWVVGES